MWHTEKDTYVLFDKRHFAVSVYITASVELQRRICPINHQQKPAYTGPDNHNFSESWWVYQKIYNLSFQYGKLLKIILYNKIYAAI